MLSAPAFSIVLDAAAKRYQQDWIFRNLSYRFESGKRYALLGPNGSGKSTLLKALSGNLTLSKGTVHFFVGEKKIPDAETYRYVSLAAPYVELIEELTLDEALRFHAALKPLRPGLRHSDLREILRLPRAANKEIRFFSSGMKQRVKLALALCSNTPLLLLDEPATNLDLQGIAWYKDLIARYAAERLVVIASNDPHDAEFCDIHLEVTGFR